VATPRPSAPPAPDAERLAREKRAAEAALAEVLRRKAVLESGQVTVWAPRDYPAALELLDRADALFAGGRFADATAAYGEVAVALDALTASRPERLAAAQARGAAALEAGDGMVAAREFAIALALEPGNEVAALGAQRARTLGRVLALLAEGQVLEGQGALEAARERFGEAVALDEHMTAAVAAVARVDVAILERDFALAMSAALVALERGQIDVAAQALRLADSLKPGAPAVADARSRVASVRQLRRIEILRRQAEAHAGAERWTEAAAVYEEALAVDPALAFAIAGKAQAGALARLHAEVDELVAAPERLADEGPLARARRVLADASALPERGSALERKLDLLDEAVAAASRPVVVLLLSDGLTQVTVYRVGRLGAFDSRRLQLRPGSYVAVGTRAGYRDVRVTFDVAPGRVASPVIVRCEEAV
jgi:tetratricopeptide (TPR) repeat protein